MVPPRTLDEVAHHIDMDKEQLITEGVLALLISKKNELLNEKLELLKRYKVTSFEFLKEKIQKGEIKEHPAWEDYIEEKNIDAEIKVIERDIKAIRKTHSGISR